MIENDKCSKPREGHHVVICETLSNIGPQSSDESVVMIGDDIKRKESIHSRRPSINVRKDSLASVISIWFSFRGIFFTALAALFFSLNASIVKHLTGVNPSLLALMRYAGTVLLSTPSLRGTKMHTIFGPPESRKWILFRALTGASAMYLRYVTVRLLPLANAIVITLSVPVFACVFARLFLKEPCSTFHAIALATTLVGIGFTAKLDVIFGSQFSSSPEEKKSIDVVTQLVGLACGLGSALSNSLTIISLRKLKNVHQSVIMWNTGWIAAIEMSIITYFLDGFHIPDSPTIPWLLMTVGIFSYYGQMMFTKALQLEEASIVAMFEASCDLVLAFVFQICFFKVIPDIFTIIGALLVTTAVLLTSFRKFLPTLAHDHSLRRWFSFLIE